MLIVYDKNTKRVVSVSGVRPEGRKLSDAEKQVMPVEPLPENQAYMHIKDEDIMEKVFKVLDAGLDLFVATSEDGNDTVVFPEIIPESE